MRARPLSHLDAVERARSPFSMRDGPSQPVCRAASWTPGSADLHLLTAKPFIYVFNIEEAHWATTAWRPGWPAL